MPYVKFETRDNWMKARGIMNEFPDEVREGLVSLVNDPQYGMLNFLSENVYSCICERFSEERVCYRIISKDDVQAPYVKILKEFHPEFLDEL